MEFRKSLWFIFKS